MLVCLLRIETEKLTLTRQNWRPRLCTMTYFDELDRRVVGIILFIVHGEIGERIAKTVGITYEIVNYTSPTHTRETSEV